MKFTVKSHAYSIMFSSAILVAYALAISFLGSDQVGIALIAIITVLIANATAIGLLEVNRRLELLEAKAKGACEEPEEPATGGG